MLMYGIQKEEYERVRMEEVETTTRLARRVDQLELDSAKDKREWEERERRLRKEEEEREQCHREENRVLKRELARLQRELQQRTAIRK